MWPCSHRMRTAARVSAGTIDWPVWGGVLACADTHEAFRTRSRVHVPVKSFKVGTVPWTKRLRTRCTDRLMVSSLFMLAPGLRSAALLLRYLTDEDGDDEGHMEPLHRCRCLTGWVRLIGLTSCCSEAMMGTADTHTHKHTHIHSHRRFCMALKGAVLLKGGGRVNLNYDI